MNIETDTDKAARELEVVERLTNDLYRTRFPFYVDEGNGVVVELWGKKKESTLEEGEAMDRAKAGLMRLFCSTNYSNVGSSILGSAKEFKMLTGDEKFYNTIVFLEKRRLEGADIGGKFRE